MRPRECALVSEWREQDRALLAVEQVLVSGANGRWSKGKVLPVLILAAATGVVRNGGLTYQFSTSSDF
jgi:hypothetical protein